MRLISISPKKIVVQKDQFTLNSISNPKHFFYKLLYRKINLHLTKFPIQNIFFINI